MLDASAAVGVRSEGLDTSSTAAASMAGATSIHRAVANTAPIVLPDVCTPQDRVQESLQKQEIEVSRRCKHLPGCDVEHPKRPRAARIVVARLCDVISCDDVRAPWGVVQWQDIRFWS